MPSLTPLTKRTILIAVLVCAVASCSDGPSSSSTDGDASTSATGDVTGDVTAAPTIEPFDADAFYVPPVPLPEGGPGMLIRSDTPDDLAGAFGDATVHRVLHLSTGITGEPVAVSGVVAIPRGDPPAGGWPVLAWAHGTTGVADICAPSWDSTLFGYSGQLSQFTSAGIAVVATDYEGLGTPGEHPYLNKESQARAVIDSVSAAHDLAAEQNTQLRAEWLVLGHSQGGQASLATAELASSHGDEALPLVGVIAAAPAASLSYLPSVIVGSGLDGYLAFAAAGILAGAPELEMADLLGPAAVERAAVLETGCWSEVMEAFSTVPAEDLWQRTPAGEAAVDEYLAANEPATTPLGVPTLLIQGSDDTTIPALSTTLLRDRLCAAGESAEYVEYPGTGHGDVLAASAADVGSWVADRFAGVAAVGCG